MSIIWLSFDYHMSIIWRSSKDHLVIICRAAGIVAALQPRCEEVEREWGNEEEMEGKWGNWEEMEREWGNVILFPFPHSLLISSFSFHFLILSPFPLQFLILSPFPRSPAARLLQVVTAWFCVDILCKYLVHIYFINIAKDGMSRLWQRWSWYARINVKG